MKKLSGILCMLLLLTMTMIACQEAPVEELAQDDSAMTTRSADEGETTFFHDQTVSSNRTVQGDNVETQNTAVSDGAKLTIVASQNITILTTLNVDAESEFEMRIQ